MDRRHGGAGPSPNCRSRSTLLGDLVTLATAGAGYRERPQMGRSCASCSSTTGCCATRHGAPRKLIIFTEHRDTLDYLTARSVTLLGRDDAVDDHSWWYLAARTAG